MCVEYEDKTCARICGLSYRSAGPEITSLDAFCGAKQYKLVKRAQEGPNLTPQTLEKSGSSNNTNDATTTPAEPPLRTARLVVLEDSDSRVAPAAGSACEALSGGLGSCAAVRALAREPFESAPVDCASFTTPPPGVRPPPPARAPPGYIPGSNQIISGSVTGGKGGGAKTGTATTVRARLRLSRELA
eukprot:1034389-Prorocentrum_minimum.AAC.7